MPFTRRTFLGTAAPGAFMTTLSPGLKVAFGADAAVAPRDILVVVFLRFGSDGLTPFPPADDADYHQARPTLATPASGSGAAWPLGALNGVQFFANPNMPEIKALYDAKELAIVHAAGLPTESRSHFVSQELMERGISDGEKQLAGGWIGRHLTARKLILPGLGAISTNPEVDVSLQGYINAIAVPDITRFDVVGGETNLRVIEGLNVGTEAHVTSARATVETIRNIKANLLSLPKVAGNPAGYTNGALSTSLRGLADIIKANVGLEVATVDFGGWDHHANLMTFFGGNARELSAAVNAFWIDMKDFRDRLTIVTMTEFGRRVQENANAGLDHGSASVMMALGGSVNGGRIYGQWPGLKAADLQTGDLRVTTDYRRVLQEILAKRRGEITPRSLPYLGLSTARHYPGR